MALENCILRESEYNAPMKKTEQNIPIITIDGPSGSGKGTLCHIIADKLNWHMLDSGAIYRVLAYAAFLENVPFDDEPALVELAKRIPIQFIPKPDGLTHVLLNNQDVSKDIRTEENSIRASKISAYPKVRAALTQKQRDFCQSPGLVTDGRDMGTVIFPNAQLKIFLVASPEERAKRRYQQLKKQGINVNLAQVLDELLARDQRDQARSASPLKPADDAIMLDTTKLSINQVVDEVVVLAQARFSIS